MSKVSVITVSLLCGIFGEVWLKLSKKPLPDWWHEIVQCCTTQLEKET